MIKTKRKVQQLGEDGVISINIPKMFAEYIKLGKGDEVNIGLDEGKHGKYISIWKEK